MKLEFHPQAELELIEEAAYYERQIPGLGERFEAEVRRATDILLGHPEIGSPADPHLRKFFLNRFPFTLYYSVTPRGAAHRGRRTPKPPPRLLAVES
jgi:plasmid stabilization system protein ParE